MENLKCTSCGAVLAYEGAWTSHLEEFTHEWGWDAPTHRINATCARCGYAGEPVPFESSRRTEKPPEIVETRVAGFRSWRANKGQLRALHRDVVWTPGGNRASCPTHGSQAPVIDCECGFNSFYRFDEWERQEGDPNGDPHELFLRRHDPKTIVCGIASASGRTVLHETGWHAEKARVEALIAYRPDIPALGGHVSVRPLLEAIAKTYGVPVISPEEAEMFCSVEGLELMEPMVGAESEVEETGVSGPYRGAGLYGFSWGHQSSQPYATYVPVKMDTPGVQKALNDTGQAALKIAKSWFGFTNTYSDHDKSGGFQEAIEAKKKKDKFYDGLDTKKGLDKPSKG